MGQDKDKPPMELKVIEGEVLTGRDGGTDAAMFRASVEIAKRYPRDPAAIIRTLLTTLDAFPAFAEKALYSIPYEDKKRGKIVKVEGMSIRAAETIASEWGNIRVGVRITGEDTDGYDLEAIAHDMQSNNVSLLPARVARVAKVGGQFVMLDPDRMRMALNAAISKVKRNVTMSVIPLQVKAAYEKKVRELLAGGDLTKLADGKRLTSALNAFRADYGVSQDRLELYVGRSVKEWLGSDLADLRALYNALEDGETTVAATFPEATPADTTPPSPVANAVVTSDESGVLGTAATPPAAKETPVAVPADPKPEERQPAAKPPDPIFDPKPVQPPAPATAEVNPMTALIATLDAQLAACTTKEEFDALLGRLYGPGGSLGAGGDAPREVKRSMIAKVNAKRDQLIKK